MILGGLVLKMNSKFKFFYYFERNCIRLEFELVLCDYLHRSKIKGEVYFLIEPLDNCGDIDYLSARELINNFTLSASKLLPLD